jgi:cobalamin biosynthesis protein CobD/CbiB
VKSRVFRKREGRIIAVCWGEIAAGWLLLWPILDSRPATFILECLQALILAITSVIMWYYTLETKRLREEAQRQTALLLRPFVFMRVLPK